MWAHLFVCTQMGWWTHRTKWVRWRRQRPRNGAEAFKERRDIVEETLLPGASVARVARRHAVNANQVFYWRKLFRECPETYHSTSLENASATASRSFSVLFIHSCFLPGHIRGRSHAFQVASFPNAPGKNSIQSSSPFFSNRS